MVTFRDNILFSIHNKTFFKHAIFALFFKNIEDPVKREQKKIRLYFNYRCNPESPRTFNEYMLWIKYHYNNDLWRRCADKLKCKDYLVSLGLEKYIPQTLKVYNSSSEINLDELPDKFVLKTNHDSGSVFICDKKTTNFSQVFQELDESLNKNYSSRTFEWFYKDIEPKIFAEEMLIPFEGSDLSDFKIFVIGGKYVFGFVAQNRSKKLRFNLFEDDFKYVNCEYIHLSSRNKFKQPKPNNFKKMIELAEKIGTHFDSVRVDFYNTLNGIRIGELTFCGMSGFGAFTKKEYDFKYGKYFEGTSIYKLAHKIE